MTRKARLLAWNRRLNDLPRRLALLAVTFGLLALALVVLPYVWPFALALLLARGEAVTRQNFPYVMNHKVVYIDSDARMAEDAP